MTTEDSAIEEFKKLETEKSSIETKLTKLEEKKSTVKVEIYQKVKTDYEAKLNDVKKQIEGKKEMAQTMLEKHTKNKQDMLSQKAALKNEIEELSLRRSIGEFADDEYEKLTKEKNESLKGIDEKVGEIERSIGFLQTLLPGAAPPTPPQEEIIPSAPPKEVAPPAEEIIPPAPPQEEIIPSAPPKEVAPPAEEIIPPAPPQEAAPKPPEGERLFSVDEIDKLIEEKIYPTEEAKIPAEEDKEPAILKEPELAPEADEEKKGLQCSKCGFTNKPDSWYCEKCGTELLEGGGIL